MHRLALVAALVALAACRASDRKPARMRPVLPGTESAEDTPGARFVASLRGTVPQGVGPDSQVVLDQKSNADGPALIRAWYRPKAEVWS